MALTGQRRYQTLFLDTERRSARVQTSPFLLFQVSSLPDCANLPTPVRFPTPPLLRVPCSFRLFSLILCRQVCLAESQTDFYGCWSNGDTIPHFFFACGSRRLNHYPRAWPATPYNRTNPPSNPFRPDEESFDPISIAGLAPLAGRYAGDAR